MTQVDFYILPSEDEDSRCQFLCKLATRALSAGHRLYVYVEDQHMAERISERLWHAVPESFLPNTITITPDTDNAAPIIIGWQLEQFSSDKDMLVNLSTSYPDSSPEFSRVAEIVTQAPEVLASTRARFKTYQSAGVTPRMHDMRKNRT